MTAVEVGDDRSVMLMSGDELHGNPYARQRPDYSGE